MDATTTTSTASTTTTIMSGLVALCMVALCQEIRNANWRGEDRDGRHLWAVDLDFDLNLPCRMNAINCAICGNYRMSRTVNQQLCSSVIVCEDEEHGQYTLDLIAIERADEDSDEYSDEDSDEYSDEDSDEDSDEYEHIIRRQ